MTHLQPTIPDMPIPTDPAELIGYLANHNWYAIAAIVLMIGLQIVRKHAADWWQKTAVGYRFLWPVGISAVVGFIHGFVTGKPINGALLDALNALWQIALPAMGAAAALKESPIPWDGGKGGSLPPPAPAPADLAEDDRLTPVDPGAAPRPPSEPPPGTISN